MRRKSCAKTETAFTRKALARAIGEYTYGMSACRSEHILARRTPFASAHVAFGEIVSCAGCLIKVGHQNLVELKLDR